MHSPYRASTSPFLPSFMLSDQFSYVSTLDTRYFDARLSKFRLLAIMNTFSQFLMKVTSYFVYLRNMAYKLSFSSTLLDHALILCVVLQGSSVHSCLLTLCTSNIGSITLQYSCGLLRGISLIFLDFTTHSRGILLQ